MKKTKIVSKAKRVLATLGVITCLCTVTAVASESYSFHIKSDSVGYGTAPVNKNSGTCTEMTSVSKVSNDWFVSGNKVTNFLVGRTSDGLQLTAAYTLGGNQSTVANYIYDGHYYGWYQGTVSLRANSTGTGVGYTVTGNWIPNNGTSYN